LFVRDNCSGVDLVLRNGEIGEIYNIGAGNERTNREVTDRLLALLGADESSVTYVEDRKGHDRRYSVATEKVEALGWRPSTTFEDGLERTVAFYADGRDWWEPLVARVKNR
ncbi:MAG: GDP-mannose 4,6-dehydratase, partial [Actinomycetes bacterium]